MDHSSYTFAKHPDHCWVDLIPKESDKTTEKILHNIQLFLRDCSDARYLDRAIRELKAGKDWVRGGRVTRLQGDRILLRDNCELPREDFWKILDDYRRALTECFRKRAAETENRDYRYGFSTDLTTCRVRLYFAESDLWRQEHPDKPWDPRNNPLSVLEEYIRVHEDWLVERLESLIRKEHPDRWGGADLRVCEDLVFLRVWSRYTDFSGGNCVISLDRFQDILADWAQTVYQCRKSRIQEAAKRDYRYRFRLDRENCRPVLEFETCRDADAPESALSFVAAMLAQYPATVQSAEKLAAGLEHENSRYHCPQGSEGYCYMVQDGHVWIHTKNGESAMCVMPLEIFREILGDYRQAIIDMCWQMADSDACRDACRGFRVWQSPFCGCVRARFGEDPYGAEYPRDNLFSVAEESIHPVRDTIMRYRDVPAGDILKEGFYCEDFYDATGYDGVECLRMLVKNHRVFLLNPEYWDGSERRVAACVLPLDIYCAALDEVPDAMEECIHDRRELLIHRDWSYTLCPNPDPHPGVHPVFADDRLKDDLIWFGERPEWLSHMAKRVASFAFDTEVRDLEAAESYHDGGFLYVGSMHDGWVVIGNDCDGHYSESLLPAELFRNLIADMEAIEERYRRDNPSGERLILQRPWDRLLRSPAVGGDAFREVAEEFEVTGSGEPVRKKKPWPRGKMWPMP